MSGIFIRFKMKRYIICALVAMAAFADAAAQFKPHTTSTTKAYNIDVLPDISYQMGEFSEGLVVIQDNKSKNCAVFNDKGEALVHFGIPMVTQMRGLPAFNHGVIPAIVNDKGTNFYLILNGKGEKVAQLHNLRSLGKNFTDGMITAFKTVPASKYRNNIVSRYYDTTGKEIYPDLWQNVTGTYETLKEARPFCDGLSCYYDYKAKRYGYFNKQGKIVIPARFVKAHDFSEGKAVVSTDGSTWIYINTAGQQCINTTFSVSEPKDFHEGYAIVYKREGNRNSPCYMNEKGEIVAGPLYNADRFIGGYAWVAVINNGINEFVVDKNFKTVRKLPRLAPHNELVYDETDNTIQAGTDVYNADGTPLFTNNRVIVKQFNNGLAPFKEGNKCGYLNKHGEIIFMFQLSNF